LGGLKLMTVCWLKRKEIESSIKKRLLQADIILDIGCGINPQKYIRPILHICCEPFETYFSCLNENIKKKYDRIYWVIKFKWEEIIRLFPHKSVDSIFLLDVIEHLEKDEAIRYLKFTEFIAKKQIIIFTPYGFFPQSHPDGIDAWGLDGGPWQEHKSGWYPEDFDETWEIFACKEFHLWDNKGNILDKPYGAFWAIKTFEYDDEISKKKLLAQDNIRNIINMIVEYGFVFNVLLKGIIYITNSVYSIGNYMFRSIIILKNIIIKIFNKIRR
jgi:hypothetical protein